MATVDWKDAEYAVKIYGDDTHFLRFLCNSKLWEFVFLRNGFSPGSRMFTRLSKSSLAMLRIQGYTVTICIDNIIAIDHSYEYCLLK